MLGRERMTPDPVTITAATWVPDALRLMHEREVRRLPVIDFTASLALLGGRRQGVRITAFTTGVKGTVSRIAGAVFGAGGDIVGLGLSEVPDAPEPT